MRNQITVMEGCGQRAWKTASRSERVLPRREHKAPDRLVEVSVQWRTVQLSESLVCEPSPPLALPTHFFSS